MLERQINAILSGMTDEGETTSLFAAIEQWQWKGLPCSQNVELHDTRHDKVTYEEVDWLIRSSTLNDALTSPSEYIRECRRWFDAKRS